MSESAETLRRKHIQTLEALQALSDENASLKELLSSITNSSASTGDKQQEGGASPLPSSVDALHGARLEVKSLEERVKSLEASHAALEKAKSLADSDVKEGKALVHRLKRELETQALLMRGLRDEEEGRESRSREEEEEKDARVAELAAEVGRLSVALKAAGSELDAERRERERIEAESKLSKGNLEEQMAAGRAEGEARLSELEGRLGDVEEERVRCITELERCRAENEALQSEVARLSGDAVKQVQLERRKSSEMQGKLDEMSKALKAKEEAVVDTEQRSPEPTRPMDRSGSDFGAFVKLKKENAALKSQLQQLQQNMRRSFRG